MLRLARLKLVLNIFKKMLIQVKLARFLISFSEFFRGMKNIIIIFGFFIII
jgi:hypothetical protein